MSIANEITRLQNAKTSIKTSIENKGVIVGDGTLDTYASKIDAIETGITPAGTINITENGTYDVTDKASANVNVPSGLGEYFNESYKFGSYPNYWLPYILKKVPVFSMEGITSMQNQFYGCVNITTIPALDTSKVTNMQNMFYMCVNIETIPQLNTSKVTNMSNMFYGCKKIVNIPPLDKASCTKMDNMFNGCEKLTIIPFADLNFDNISNVYSMFSNCYSLTSVGNLSFANAPHIEHLFSCSYQDMSNLETIGNVYCPKATSLYNAFQNLSKLVSIGEIACEAATNVRDMLSNNKALQNIGGLINLGQAYSTTESANNSYYTLNLSTSKLLTHDSLMNVINNLYDIATKGCNTQMLRLGSTNLAKLTAEEIAIATNKGWTVS